MADVTCERSFTIRIETRFVVIMHDMFVGWPVAQHGNWSIGLSDTRLFWSRL